jgi:hypothetical protein
LENVRYQSDRRYCSSDDLIGNVHSPIQSLKDGNSQDAFTWTDPGGNFWMFGGTTTTDYLVRINFFHSILLEILLDYSFGL